MTAAGVRTEASVFSNIPSSFYNYFQFWSNIEYGQDLKSLQSHIVGHPEGSCYFKCCRYISCKLRAYLHKMWMEGELVSTASHHPPANLQTQVRPHPARGETCQKNLAVLEKFAHQHSITYGGSINKSKPNHIICNHGQEAFF